jgi:pimeloyl-ACP methyl ester carboxylesterase
VSGRVPEPGEDYQFTTDPVEADLPGAGVQIHYLDWGPAPGPAIVFLHGGGLNAHTWDVVCDLLHAEFRCVAIDLRGHGDSDWHDEGDYSLAAHARDLRAAVTGLQLGTFVLVGMSLGGSVALTYAAEHASDLLGLVLVDMGPGGSRPAGAARLGAFMQGPAEFASVDEVIERALTFNPRRSRERLRRTIGRNLRQTAQGTWTWKYDRRFPSRAHDRSVPETERRRLLQERTRALWAAARRVACPTLVVRGGESDMFLDEDAERTAAGFADGRWVRIEGASHTVQSDAPRELAAVIRGFVATG